MTILDQLAQHAAERVKAAMKQASLAEIRNRASALPPGSFAFEETLRKPGISFICECKKASPSKGIIAEDFPYLDIARAYEEAGADCISVLTEPKWFLGSDGIFREIRGAVALPMLRKDFVVDAYQIDQAKVMGADAVLLICSLLDTATIARYLERCDALGLAALVEAHDEQEIASAVSAGARIIGVNNRNLRDFSVDFGNAARLRDLIPPGTVYVAESGVTGPASVAKLVAIGADAALIGEALMRAPDKAAMLRALREAAS